MNCTNCGFFNRALLAMTVDLHRLGIAFLVGAHMMRFVGTFNRKVTAVSAGSMPASARQ